MRVVSLGAACAVGAVLAIAAPAAASPPPSNHYSFRDESTFTNTDCGDPITVNYVNESSGLFKLKNGSKLLFFNNYSSVETYTNVANGKTATIVSQGLFKDLHKENLGG